jgi:hypothetical protein
MGNSSLVGRCFRRPTEALTSHYLVRGGVDLSFESVLRHETRCRGTSRGSSHSDDLEPGHLDVILVLGHDRNR